MRCTQLASQSFLWLVEAALMLRMILGGVALR
jgi:hypothetical protein